MSLPIRSFTNLAESLSQFPGIGRKSAERIALFLIKQNNGFIDKLVENLKSAKSSIIICEKCFNYTDKNPCKLCESEIRNKREICVVAEPLDVSIIERSSYFNGRYHVLGGLLSPISGITPNKLKIDELMKRIKDEKIEELILALSSNLEGEATSIYISQLAKPLGTKVTKIASGIPVGGSLEYIDDLTLKRAFEARTVL